MSTTLIVPGLRSSGPTHWQTWLERRVSGSVRVTQRDWNDPHLPEWSARVRREIARATGSIFIAAHSFGALAAAQAASDHAERITGALLVAPADPEGFGVAEFLPVKPLGFPVVVVASRNDPWMAFDKARRWAELWRADFVDLGDAGHINAEAGFGPWPEGLALLERLRRAAEFRSAAERLAALELAHGQPLQRHWLARRRQALRVSQAFDQRDLIGAAALLRSAGWSVGAPSEQVRGTR
ncbi:alpha/beta hydrolase [Hyphomicrobium sp.]|uniref:RBBP9/YdeN family alpha/beta hydrolase n=1 Tax=Hyphomicrobium sp. TaxID=82 RepID=UPI002D77414D|nr:alpha/beta hydrolase [Hyphomicrobium sp.]HET6389025.1 alpha/beta hydrolase [Hyphomicrobium sp.]